MDWLHIVFLIFPLIYLLIALWSYLERMGDKLKNKGKDAGLFLKQGVFLLIGAIITILIDVKIYPDLLPSLPLPPLMVRVLTFLVILFVMSKLVGGTEAKSLKLNKPAGRKGNRRK